MPYRREFVSAGLEFRNRVVKFRELIELFCLIKEIYIFYLQHSALFRFDHMLVVIMFGIQLSEIGWFHKIYINPAVLCFRI